MDDMSSSDRIKVGLIQMDVVHGDPVQNRKKAEQMIVTAAREGASLVVLPELWPTGVNLEPGAGWAENWDGETVSLICRLAASNGLYIVGGSFMEQDRSGIYNTSFVAAPSGQVTASYRKVHLFPLMGENRFFRGGESLTVVSAGKTPIGLSICYDVRFPELYRCLAEGGARIITIPAAFPRPRDEHWVTLCRARAIENQVFVLAVNRVGSDPGGSFFGRSLVIDPWGEVLREGDDREQVIIAELDLALVDEVRARIPVWSDRRPRAYRLKGEQSSCPRLIPEG